MRLGLKFWPDKLVAKFAHFVKGIAFFGRTSSLLAGWAHRPDGLMKTLSPFGLDELVVTEPIRPPDELTFGRTGSNQAGWTQSGWMGSSRRPDGLRPDGLRQVTYKFFGTKCNFGEVLQLLCFSDGPGWRASFANIWYCS